jgi:hypothetical protein
MDKTKINYFIDVCLAIALCSVALTGILKFPGLLSGLGISRTSLPMGTISKVHDWSGIALASLVLIHLVMHWQWIVAFTKIMLKFGKK